MTLPTPSFLFTFLVSLVENPINLKLNNSYTTAEKVGFQQTIFDWEERIIRMLVRSHQLSSAHIVVKTNSTLFQQCFTIISNEN